MNYREAREYLTGSSKAGISPGLERIERLLYLLGSPQERKPVIHVAGTNGKGSVCAYIASVLQKASYRVGRYSSPAVYDERDIIQIDGISISEEDYAAGIEGIKELVSRDDFLKNDMPTSFEMETALAYSYLGESDIDIMLIETGMGGRLDATNMLKEPLLSVICSVSMDHMAFLGDSVEEIATEKAGIIKRGRPVLAFGDDERVLSVIKAKCLELSAPLTVVKSEDIKCFDIQPSKCPVFQEFSYGGMEGLKTSMLGAYAPLNAAMAVKACRILSEEPDIEISDEDIRKGIELAKWSGRFEVIRNDIPVIIDGAHNRDAAAFLKESVDRYFSGRQRVILLMGVFADKDYEKMLEIMSQVSEDILVFRAPGARGLDEDVLASAASKYFKNVIAAKSLREAIDICCSMAKASNSAVVQFGTLSVIAESSRLWRENDN